MNFKDLLSRIQTLNISAQWRLMGAVVFMILGAVAMGIWANTDSVVPVYPGLSEKESASAYDALKQAGFSVSIAQNGQLSIAPAELYRARYQLASLGLPESNTNLTMQPPGFGASVGQENAYRQAILERELARSILTIQGIKSARVHIAYPKTTVFGKEINTPTASVIIDKNDITQPQADAIKHLVAKAVPGLQSKDTSIVSAQGNLLDKSTTASLANNTPEQLTITANLRKDYQERIQRLLTPIVGKDGAKAEVDLDISFEDENKSVESWKPNVGDAAIRSARQEETVGRPSDVGGVPGSASNLPPLALPPLPGVAVAPVANAASNPGGASNSTKLAVTNYELDRSVTQTNKNSMNIKKVKAAVLLGQKHVKGKDGQLQKVAFTPDEITQITALVRDAVGYDQTRGDSVLVVSMPFGYNEPPAEEIKIPIWADPNILSLATQLAKWLAMIIFVIISIRMLRSTLLSVFPPEVVKETNSETPPNSQSTQQDINNSNQADAALSADQAKQLATSNPAAVATVIKEWIAVDKPE